MFFPIQLMRNIEIFGGKGIEKQNQLSRQKQEAPTVPIHSNVHRYCVNLSEHTMKKSIGQPLFFNP
ncbi:MAG: hypothetical protein DMG13_17645 [Acidobacteria bacterium]|nr:MAG: hypothetical protein DMG13_17645 [Acidobacteriota bacterium]